jgi:hypothetical protein
VVLDRRSDVVPQLQFRNNQRLCQIPAIPSVGSKAQRRAGLGQEIFNANRNERESVTVSCCLSIGLASGSRKTVIQVMHMWRVHQCNKLLHF